MLRIVVSALVACLMSLPAWTQVTVDGTRDAAYGAALAVQTVNTQFGDAAPPGDTSGGELDAAYAVLDGGRLYVLLTGNLAPASQKLEVFIDSRPGGENVLSGTPQYDTSNTSANMAGMTFDSGFEADYHLFTYWGAGNGPFSAHFVNRQGGGSAQVPGSLGATANAVGLQAAGVVSSGNVGPNASGTALTQNLEFAINDNNTGGVISATTAANATNAAAVTTGVEFSIALADLGNPAPGDAIRILAAIDNNDHNFLSNQALAGLPAGSGNLGGDGGGGFTGVLAGVDFTDFAGSQYFVVQIPRLQGDTAVPALTGWGGTLLALVMATLAWVVLARRAG